MTKDIVRSIFAMVGVQKQLLLSETRRVITEREEPNISIICTACSLPRCPPSTRFVGSPYLMTKPTLVQSLLNRPSQTYAGPNVPRQEYYSTKQEMLGIAAEEAARRLSGKGPRVVDVGIYSIVRGSGI